MNKPTIGTRLELRDLIYVGSLLVAMGVAYGKLASMDARISDVQADVRTIYRVLIGTTPAHPVAVQDATRVILALHK